MISKEIDDNTSTGRQLQPSFERKELGSDDLVGNLVINKLKDCDVNIPEARLGGSKRGWLLDGFPKNRNQAFRLQSFGCIPDKIFILDSNRDDVTYKLIDRDVARGKDRAEAEVLAQRRVKEYFLHLDGIKRAYEG